MDRDLAYAVGEAHGEFSTGTAGACENVHNCVGAFGSRHPDLKDGFGFLGQFSDIQGSSGEENHCNVLIYFIYFVEKGLLDLGYLYVGVAGGFTGLDVVLT